nr:fibrobacter succinogenes major paralogous domain-containing protein [uncultured Carboxylicivirga sp.]
MKLINRILLLLVVSLTIATTTKAQEIMYIYKDGAVVGEHVLAEVDSVIFYKADVAGEKTVTDIDGNIYNTVVIGTQTWMAENLRTSKYKDGVDIPYVSYNVDWNSSLTSDAYCWHNNDESYKIPYGGIYNWYTVATEKLCPSGWHVPSDAEWTILINYLGGSAIAGNKLKVNEAGGTNEVGFNAQLGGSASTSFGSLGSVGYYWTSTIFDSEFSYLQVLYSDMERIDRFMYDRPQGFSVRCLKD